jgi:FkbM family methyltransferase
MNDKYNGDLDKGYYLDQFIEKLLLERFGVDRGGVFLDVGAYHPRVLSNSFYFEKEKDFKVICIEANPRMAELLRASRQNVFECAAWEKAGETLEFQVVEGPWDPYGFGGSCLWWGDKHPGLKEKIKVTTRTINDILEEAGVDHVDAVSMDIEGAEKYALKGFDFDKYKPRVLCIERHQTSEDQGIHYDLEKFMKDRGYEFVDRLHVDDFYIRIKP